MRAVLQRAASASVTIDGQVVGRFEEPGLVVLLGITHDDGTDEVAWMVRKIQDLRIMREERSVADLGAPVLVISQFTLYGDARKGRRPTWLAAAPGEVSEPLRRALGWTPTWTLAETVAAMVAADVRRLETGVEEHESYLASGS